MTKQNDRPEVNLIGRSGNAFAILGACLKAARKAGWAPEKVQAVHDEMIAGDYNHLLAIVVKYFDVS